MHIRRYLINTLTCFVLILSIIAGCASRERKPVSVEQMALAQTPRIPGIRDFGYRFSHIFQEDIRQSVLQEKVYVFPVDSNGRKIYKGLALSGGGANGAIGAGFLVGWTSDGTHPDFKLVTGTSTGNVLVNRSRSFLLSAKATCCAPCSVSASLLLIYFKKKSVLTRVLNSWDNIIFRMVITCLSISAAFAMLS
jgi:hypothetical protein